MEYKINTPVDKAELQKMRAGDTVLLSGDIYTARDAAHGRMAELLAQGKELPFVLAGSIIYYAGPTPAPSGRPIGSIGPTTAGRVDAYTPLLLENGLLGMIGKGARSEAVLQSMQKNGAVYFGFIGGAGALAAACVTASKLVAWEELGSEAVRRLTVEDFPLTVLADTVGGDLYSAGPKEYLAAQKQG